MSCSMELVEMLDKIDLEKKKVEKEEEITKEDLLEHEVNELKGELEETIKELRGTSEECFDLRAEKSMFQQENNYLKCMLKNMILTLVAQENHDLEWEIKRDYGMNYNDNYIRYKNRTLRDLCEEMSDTDFNEDGERSTLEFDDNMIFYHFNDIEDLTTDSEVFSDEDED